MLLSKENVIVYTIQLDTDKVQSLMHPFDLLDMFKKEFENAGMIKEAKQMDKGGFSYRETERNSYYTEYKISITTRRKIM